jgi:hypothetical protein
MFDRDVFEQCFEHVSHVAFWKIADGAFVNVAQFRYLGMAVTGQILIQKEIKRRLN